MSDLWRRITLREADKKVDAVMKWTSQAGPVQTKRVMEVLKSIQWEGNTYITLSGVLGGRADRTVHTVLCGGVGRTDVPEALTQLGEQFAWTITRDNHQTIMEAGLKALETLKANRPVKDERETAEAVAQRMDEAKRAEEERVRVETEKTAAFTALYAEAERVTVEKGQTGVYLKLCYDNSDIMTDYFDSHASLGPDLLLSVGPVGVKQAETERLARAAVARYDWLLGVEFSWHTEKYSMGHGNYLSSSGHELPEELKAWSRQYYRGGEVTHGHWEVKFNRWNSGEVLAAKGYKTMNAFVNHLL